MHLTHTRTNIVLLAAGALVCMFNTFLLIMTAGFGADPVHDFRSLAIQWLLCVGLLSCPCFLLMLRWSRVGSIAMWCVALCYSLVALVGGAFFHLLGLVILLLIEALICGAIDSGSPEGSAS
jgi:hypothetical protein